MRRGVALLSVLLLAAAHAGAEGTVVEGEEIWRIILTPAKGSFRDLENFRDYRNESNVQRILEAGPKRVVIERRVSYAPFHNDLALAETGIYAKRPELATYLAKPTSARVLALAEQLSQGVTTQLGYVDAVMYDVRDRLVWRSTSIVEPEAVLEAGYSLCAGFANIAAALLRAKGVPARVAHVLALRHPSWNEGRHAEVEVYYEGAGWVSYDPQAYEHYGPMPRITYGYSDEAAISSTDAALWRATMYFGNLSYNVQYQLVKDDVRQVGLTRWPLKHDFATRADGVAALVPTVSGVVFDGNGAPSTEECIYYALDAKSTSYDGAPLRNGSFVVRNDADGGRLFMDSPGYAVYYDFPGSAGSTALRHDIRFDASDSMVVQTLKAGSSVKWFFRPSSYMTFEADRDGVLRLHVNQGTGSYKVGSDTWVFRDGEWRKGS